MTLNTGFLRADFDSLLASRQFAYADAITLKLLSGTILSYATSQQSFTSPQCDGEMGLRTYVANDVLVSGLRFKCSNGSDSSGQAPSLAVDEQSVTFFPNATPAWPSLIDGVPFLQAVGRGALDAAVIERDRWYFAAPGSKPVGGVPLFYGFTSDIEQLSRTQAVFKVKSDLVLLDTQMPRNLYQPNCQYTVYSSGCGADKTAFAAHDFVGASPSRSFIPWTSATAQYTGGEVTLTSGADIGQARTILKADTTGLWLAYPLPVAPLAGDHFTAYPGCDRTYGGGCAYFSRQAAFRATPFVPGAVFGV